MSLELSYLVWSTVLVGAYILVQSAFYRIEHGIEFAVSGRDGEVPDGKYGARSAKALRNLLETYGAFVALAAAAGIAGISNGLTQWGAGIYFWSRWVYLPLYVFGIAYVRSLVWLVSALGLGLMFLGLVL